MKHSHTAASRFLVAAFLFAGAMCAHAGTGDTPARPASQKIKLADIPRWQAQVWQEWQRVVAQDTVAALPSLTPLRDSVVTRWALPASLEPDAVMPFFYGVKDNGQSSEGKRQYPLFLYLHGSGPKAMEWQAGWMWAQRFDDAPSAYFIPQIPNEGQWYRWWQQSKQWAWENLLRHALASGDIDPDRVFIIGISEGGYGSQRLASFYADYLAGAGPMAGGEPLKNAPVENCANIAFSFLTGAEDYGFYRNKLTTYTLQAFDSLQQAWSGKTGDSLFRHRIELIPGRGHAIDYTRTTPWLRRYSRNPWPKTVLWEDYAMDGRHRTAFANLLVEQRPQSPNDDWRTSYQMVIRDNTINLTIEDVTYTTTEKDRQWGIDLKFSRTRKPATGGSLRVFLNSALVDLTRPVTVIVNGKRAFRGKVQPDVADLRQSCRALYDPQRLFPASVLVNY